MDAAPDFEKLRADRNAAFERDIEKIKAVFGVSNVHTGFDPSACYCGCMEGGPCEHKFDGWREFEDGRGGEQFCQRCGQGAMAHSMSIDW